MPKLKVDHIVSFSSEDSVHSASNVLLSETSKKWKCATPGEKSSSVVLQLEKASVISSVDIGNEHSAYIEVLVSRSSASNDFTVLLVMSSFMTPLESRQSTNVNKVRMFGYNDFQSPERDEKWDRVKIVCTQPFNRHVQYGLSFVTLNSLESKDASTPTAVKLGKFLLRPSSPESLSAGSLFSRRKELASDAPLTAAAAIRVASTAGSINALQPMLKLKHNGNTTPTTLKKVTSSSSTDVDTPKTRNRNELLYDDEELPNKKIDQVIELKNKEKEKKASEESKTEKKKKQHVKQADVKAKINPSTSDTSKRKLKEADKPNKKVKANKTKLFKELLSGVVIVISGIQNPERATLRDNALEMGAKYKADWDDRCTHLICAFSNTPKFKQVQGKGKIVNRLWIKDCHDQRKRLPWRRYALDSKDQSKNESEDEIWEVDSNTPEIDVIYQRDGSKLKDEVQADSNTSISDINCYAVDTDEEEFTNNSSNHTFLTLPDFLSTKVFFIDQYLSATEIKELKRYITAYKGLLLEDPSDIVDFAITSVQSKDTLKDLCPNACLVTPDWIWECHNLKALTSHDKYML